MEDVFVILNADYVSLYVCVGWVPLSIYMNLSNVLFLKGGGNVTAFVTIKHTPFTTKLYVSMRFVILFYVPW